MMYRARGIAVPAERSFCEALLRRRVAAHAFAMRAWRVRANGAVNPMDPPAPDEEDTVPCRTATARNLSRAARRPPA